MVCQGCGNPVTAEVRFCPRCGAEVAAAPPVAPPPIPPTYSPQSPGLPPIYPPNYALASPRVQRNLQVLGVLWCIFGVYRVVAGLIGIFAMRMMAERRFNRYGWTWSPHFHGHFGHPWMGALIPMIGIFTVIMAGLAFLVGFGLLSRQPWGRMVAIVIAVLSLLKFPLGTALGIYTLWVLVPSQSAMEYDALADHS